MDRREKLGGGERRKGLTQGGEHQKRNKGSQKEEVGVARLALRVFALRTVRLVDLGRFTSIEGLNA